MRSAAAVRACDTLPNGAGTIRHGAVGRSVPTLIILNVLDCLGCPCKKTCICLTRKSVKAGPTPRGHQERNSVRGRCCDTAGLRIDDCVLLTFTQATTPLCYLCSAHGSPKNSERATLLLRWDAPVWTRLWYEDVRVARFLTRFVSLCLHDKASVVAERPANQHAEKVHQSRPDDCRDRGKGFGIDHGGDRVRGIMKSITRLKCNDENKCSRGDYR
jgi:hypothetical protein